MGGLVCVDDSKARASKLLEVLEKSILLRRQHKEQIQENTVLKHKEKELEHLKHLVFQYQGQLPTLD
ncbi:hypothetical protein GQ457_05G025600 [Hibiscus cannabinus]